LIYDIIFLKVVKNMVWYGWLFLGCIIGVIVMGVISAGAYQKGYEDGQNGVKSEGVELDPY
jgi:hypothetical protein